MASLVLSVAGGVIGGAFGAAGALVGRIAGAVAGSMIDRSLFGGGDTVRSGPRLGDVNVMTSTEGAPIPRVYGRARLSGQVIWATPLEEVVAETTESSGGKGFGGPTTTTTTFSYFANFAVGLCEGEIGRVGRIWADGKLVDLATVQYRVHTGRDDQAADELIVAKEGAGNAPAYRGLAYIVFERLALASFGNRIPQLTFEIVRPIGRLERMVRAVTLIPGATEFGYEPQTVVRIFGPGVSAPENRHVANAPSDIVAALDDLQGVCPRLERVAIVVAWFGSDLRAEHCVVQPGVDNAGKVTSPVSWSVAGLSRGEAHLVSQIEGRAAFGGTPSDASLIHLIGELKARGLKVTLYPFVMMDIAAGNTLADPWSDAASQPAYPWRGDISCDPAPGRPGSPQGTPTAAAQVANFFTGGSWNYRRMVLHYAQLAVAAGGVDAFLVGSELKALTRVRSGSGVYPGVAALVALAEEVRVVIGPGTLITYGADWTEYGADVIDGGAEVRFPLDALWSSSAIDAVGIDYYAPLADWRDSAGHRDLAQARSIYEPDYLRGNLRAGEGFDWYYASDAARAAQHRSDITDGLGKPWIYRVKDLWNWWSQPHVERVGGMELGSATGWAPQSKPIWLTEIGCPALDKGANQPSVFPDSRSGQGQRPYFSSGQRDDLIQRRMLESIIANFDPAFGADGSDNPVSELYGGRMVDPSAIHLWTWDCRPYPIFPAAGDVWGDVGNWNGGHWLTGRLGGAPLDALVEALLRDSGVTDVDTSALIDSCDGYVVDRPMTPRAMIEPLALCYAFDAAASGGVLRFLPRGGAVVAELGEDDLVVPDRGTPVRLTRAQETELPREAGLGFTDCLADYRRSAETSRKLVGGAARMLHADLAVVTYDTAARRRAEILLQDLWAGRERSEFALGLNRIGLTPGDVIALTLQSRRRLFEISGFTDTDARQVTARSIDPEVFATPLPPPSPVTPVLPPSLGPVAAVALNLPALDDASPVVLTRLAVSANPWPGAVAVWASVDGASFRLAAMVAAPTAMGVTLDDLPAGPVSRWDHASAMRVRLHGGALASLSDAAVLAGGNAAAVEMASGAWEIIAFGRAELVDGQTWRLSRLLRGLAGSDAVMMDAAPAGARFVMLGPHLVPLARGLDHLARPMTLRVVAAARSHDDATAVTLEVTPDATALTPLAPVHLRARRASGGIRISWIRRTRIDGDSWAGADVPLGEASEAYVLDILDGGAVKRSYTCSVPEQLYASADEAADFGGPQSGLRVRVAQLSAITGAGAAAERTLAV